MSKKIPDITFTNNLLPKKGRILLSDPFLGDEFFERSVVFLCEHSKEGSFGFVMNHYIEVNLHDLNEKFPYIESKISIGGPVEKDTLYFMHSFGNDLNDSLEISNGIYMGYSGWTSGQLLQEIKDNSWIVCNIDNFEEIMSTKEEDMWKYFMNKLGPKYELISKFPLDPNEN